MALFIMLNNSSIFLNKLANFCFLTAFSYFYYQRYLIKYRYHKTLKIAKIELVNKLKIISEEEFTHLEKIAKREMKKELNNQIYEIYQKLVKNLFSTY
jgi:hypothetical protein